MMSSMTEKEFDSHLKAAENGNLEAQLCVAVHLTNLGDDVGAFGWYLKAANQGNVEAQNQLGFYYKEGLSFLFCSWVADRYVKWVSALPGK